MKLVSLENITKYNELLNKKIVKSVNSIKPDENGNVLLGTEKSTFNKVVYDTGYFSIDTAQTYNFDLTGSDLENASKENVNVRLVAKVTTAGDGFEVGDIAQLTPTIDHAATSGDLDVCTYIRGNTFYVYSGNNASLSIRNGVSWLEKANVQIKAVLTAFIPDDGSILLTAEDQTNTSKLIGLPDGTLTWKDKNLVRSVNGVNADTSGNVVIKSDASKADKDLTNINNIGKITIAHNAMPSLVYDDLTLGASGTSYTAPSNGYVYIAKKATAKAQYINIESSGRLAVQMVSIEGEQAIRCFLPIAKGAIFRIIYSLGGTTETFRFVYAVGSVSEKV